jgi:polar amino acid transport system substrate-binding protein
LRLLLAAILVGLAALHTTRVAGAEPTIVLAGASDVRQSVQGAWLELIYREAFRRLGYQFQYLAVPARRASVLADSGKVDGEIHRIAYYGKEHRSLVRVEEPHFAAVFSAYASRPLTLSNGWDSLRHTAYRVEYRMGNLKCETELPRRVDPARLSSVAHSTLGLRKLAAGRTDLYIDGELLVEATLTSAEFRSTSIHKVATMEQINGYAFLHPKHRALAVRLAATLAQMKREGTIERFRNAALATQAHLQHEPVQDAP